MCCFSNEVFQLYGSVLVLLGRVASIFHYRTFFETVQILKFYIMEVKKKPVHLACHVRSRSDQISAYPIKESCMILSCLYGKVSFFKCEFKLVVFSSLLMQLLFDQGGGCFVMPQSHPL